MYKIHLWSCRFEVWSRNLYFSRLSYDSGTVVHELHLRKLGHGVSILLAYIFVNECIACMYHFLFYKSFITLLVITSLYHPQLFLYHTSFKGKEMQNSFTFMSNSVPGCVVFCFCGGGACICSFIGALRTPGPLSFQMLRRG